MREPGPTPIPAIVNTGARRVRGAVQALRRDARFEVREVGPDEVVPLARTLAKAGAPKILVAGGDGTLGRVAEALARSHTAIAVLPSGTLNHFARDLGIPIDPARALDVAVSGFVRAVDAAEVNGRLFLNTSSVGAYVPYVRARRRLEPWIGYRAASGVAALGALHRVRGYEVRLEVEGVRLRYDAPLVFVGVGEREFGPPSMGGRAPGGARQLHVLVLRETSRLALVRLVARAATRGLDELGQETGVHGFLVDRCEVELPRPDGTVAVDGELVHLRAPLEYHRVPGAVRVVIPSHP